MARLSTLTSEEKADLKSRIAQVMSEILSDKYDCNITLKFVPKEGVDEDEQDQKSA